MAEFSIIQDIVDAAGIKAATAIVEEKGGQEHVYFPLPDSLRCNHWLVLLIGMEKAKSVCSVIGGGRVLIPKQIRHQKEEHIFQLIRDGDFRTLWHPHEDCAAVQEATSRTR